MNKILIKSILIAMFITGIGFYVGIYLLILPTKYVEINYISLFSIIIGAIIFSVMLNIALAISSFYYKTCKKFRVIKYKEPKKQLPKSNKYNYPNDLWD